MKKHVRALTVTLLVVMLVCVNLLAFPIFASSDYEASVTITTPSGTQSYTGTFLDMRAKVNSAMSRPSVKTEVKLTLHKDVAMTSASGTLSATSSANGHFIFDLAGYDFAIDTISQGANFIVFPGAGSVTVTGKGKDGDVSKILSRSKAGFFYSNAASTDAVVSISDIDFTFTNMALGFCDNAQYPHQPMFNLTAGDITLNNVKVIYTASEATAVEGSTGGADISKLHPPFIQANGTASIKIDNCEFTDANTKGIMTYGIFVTKNTTSVEITDTKIHAYNAIHSIASNSVILDGCELSAKHSVFANAATPILTDCTVYASDCPLTTGSARPLFGYGNGKGAVYANSTGINGSYDVEEGYSLNHAGDGKYVVADPSGYSTVELSAIYQSGMVLQRGEPVVISGRCRTDGNTVEVTLGDIKRTATVSDGEWSVSFDAMSAAKGLTLTVEELEPENSEPFTFDDIAIGDVFILSGQSNMDYQARYLEDYEEFRANANNYSNLRGFLVPNSYRHGEDLKGSGQWTALTSEHIGDFSAIGYVMATKLAAELGDDVTVAIVDATYPGSIAKTWIDIDTYIEHFGKNHTDVTTYNAYFDFYKKNGRCPTSASELSAWVGKSYQQVVASCYDSMIAFMKNYTAKAVVWYQGEGDLGRVSLYPAMYKALTDSFRKTFNNSKLPFAVIQLAPYSSTSTSNFRVMQQTLPNVDPYTYIVPTSTEGAVFNSPEFVNNSSLSLVFVHTSRKSPIGLNTADVLLSKVYGDIDIHTSPELVKVQRDGERIILTFTTDLTFGGVDTALGFEIATEYGVYVKADAVIDGNTVTLSADGVGAPKRVRYGYGDFFIEYQDGTVITPVNGYGNNSNGSMTSTSVTFYDTNGNKHTITKDAQEVLRSCIPGNVTSVNGAPLGVFEITVD